MWWAVYVCLTSACTLWTRRLAAQMQLASPSDQSLQHHACINDTSTRLRQGKNDKSNHVCDRSSGGCDHPATLCCQRKVRKRLKVWLKVAKIRSSTNFIHAKHIIGPQALSLHVHAKKQHSHGLAHSALSRLYVAQNGISYVRVSPVLWKPQCGSHTRPH